jgi:hypothetical protein
MRPCQSFGIKNFSSFQFPDTAILQHGPCPRYLLEFHLHNYQVSEIIGIRIDTFIALDKDIH